MREKILTVLAVAVAATVFADAPPPAQMLSDPDGERSDYFGWRVSADDDYVVVTSPGVGLDSQDGVTFVYSASTWDLLYKWETDEAPGSWLGNGLAVHDGIAAIGGPVDSVMGEVAGTVFLVDLATGTQLAHLYPPTSRPYDLFGAAIAMDGERLVVGARQLSSDPGEPKASGYVCVYDTDTLALRYTLVPSDGEPGELFGASVALADDLIVVGTGYDFYHPLPYAVYLYDARDGSERRIIYNPADDMSAFGNVVATDGERVIVGGGREPGEDGGPSLAVVYVFDAENGDLVHRIRPPEENESELGFGYSLEISGDLLFVGSGAWGEYRSKIYIYDYGSYELIAVLEEPVLSGYPSFGYSISVAGDLLVASTPFDSNPKPYINEIGSAWLIDISQYTRPADLNDDGVVDESDLALLIAAWGGAEPDLDADGVVGAGDIAIVLSRWECE